MKATSLLFVHLPIHTVSAPSALIFSSFIFVGVEWFEQWNLQSFFIRFSLFVSSLYVFPFISLHPFHAQTQTQTQIYFFAFHKLMNNGSKSRKADTK